MAKLRGSVLTGVLVLLLASSGWAQLPATGEDVTGTIQYIDLSNNTIHFTDGRIVHLDPNARVMIGGRQVAFDQLQPGTTVVIQRQAASSATAGQRPLSSQQPSAQQPSGGRALSTHPAVDASGRVARIDRQAGTVTFEDGRVLKVTERTDVWQPTRLEALQPGMHVFVSNAQPIAFQQSSLGDARMGTIGRVDSANRVVVLDDGTVVRVAPETTLRAGDKTTTLAELRPGDQIVIRYSPQGAVGVSGDSAGSALPRGALSGSATIDAREIHLMRLPQAP